MFHWSLYSGSGWTLMWRDWKYCWFSPTLHCRLSTLKCTMPCSVVLILVNCNSPTCMFMNVTICHLMIHPSSFFLKSCNFIPDKIARLYMHTNLLRIRPLGWSVVAAGACRRNREISPAATCPDLASRTGGETDSIGILALPAWEASVRRQPRSSAAILWACDYQFCDRMPADCATPRVLDSGRVLRETASAHSEIQANWRQRERPYFARTGKDCHRCDLNVVIETLLLEVKMCHYWIYLLLYLVRIYNETITSVI